MYIDLFFYDGANLRNAMQSLCYIHLKVDENNEYLLISVNQSVCVGISFKFNVAAKNFNNGAKSAWN